MMETYEPSGRGFEGAARHESIRLECSVYCAAMSMP